MEGKNKPTKHEFHIKGTLGDSVVRCHAGGIDGLGLRTFTLTDLFVDECREINREVFISVEPMLSVTGGTRDYSSTPGGTEGYFYDCSKPEAGFTVYHVSAEDCPRHSKKFLEQKKALMTELEYAQEYLGEFLGELKQLYPESLVKELMELDMDLPEAINYLGVDVGGMGADPSCFESIKTDGESAVHYSHARTNKTYTTEVTSKIKALDSKNDYERIFVDDGGLGFGVISELLHDEQTSRKSVAINSSSRVVDRDEGETKIMKTELYMNLLRLMEKKKIKILKNVEVYKSLTSIQHEPDGKIHGKDDHATDALIRAVWPLHRKVNKVWIDYF